MVDRINEHGEQGTSSITRRNLLGLLSAAVATGAMGTLTPNSVEAQTLRTSFSSLQEASRYAQSQGMVLARAYNGEMRIVSQELANLLDAQGFQLGQDGILYGFENGAIFEGFNFAKGVDFLEKNSKKITIQPEHSDNDEEDVGEGPEDTEEDTPEDTEEDTEDTEEDTPENTHEDTV